MKTEQKTKPILFSTPMVLSLLKGEKTQTRRVVKDQLDSFGKPLHYSRIADKKSPYYKGDYLWVRETWREAISDTHECFAYKADNMYQCGKKAPEGFCPKWKPSIFMPKKACRLFLKIEDVRVERLQAISEEDAIAEGIEQTHSIKGCHYYRDYLHGGGDLKPQESFQSLWVSIHGQQSWEQNPWVWVIKFQKK